MNRSSFLTCFLFVLLALNPVSLSAQPGEQRHYEKIDQYALATPPQAETSLTALAHYLGQGASDEVEKARVVFRWIADNIAYDTQGLFTGDYGDLSAQGVLKRRRAVCDGYAALYQALATRLGLTVVKISGYSKGYGYAPGITFTNTNHAWNGVKIKDQWYLLDVTWGAGHLDNHNQFVPHFTEHYFLTPPETFIYDHLPAEPKWQLLAKPISMPDYQAFVYLRPAFFTTGLGLVSHNQSMIDTGDQLQLTLAAPPQTLVTGRLIKAGQKLSPSLLFTQKKENHYQLHLVFPQPGQYTLRLFAKLKNSLETRYNWALDYQVTARQGKAGRIGFPISYEAMNQRQGFLYTPLEKNLKAGRPIDFRIQVPQAKKVAVITQGEWHYLQQKGDLFTGQVIVSPGDVGLFALFPGNKQYEGLLKYQGM